MVILLRAQRVFRQCRVPVIASRSPSKVESLSLNSSTDPRPSALRSWWQAVLIYREPRVLAMLFLGFSAGLPFMLVFQTLSAWLRQAGIERATIGMLAWVGIVYSIKFLWAPIVDRFKLPLLYRL